MKTFAIGVFAFVLALMVGSSAMAQNYVPASMNVNEKDIVDTAVATPQLSTLVAAVKAAGLVDTLKSDGPFTVFAPVNDAFAKLPAGTVETLLKPENKGMLTSVLTYHVIAGKFEAKDVVAAIKAGNGKAELTTVQGGKIWAKMDGKNVVLKDEKGNKSTVLMTDVMTSNGVVHVIDSVVMPK
ncbi:fasciclin domain-containing protein [Leptolyngbya sp. 7M]|uniref:fasciclin domain-containing protein n=1 Tax=Leptolyngbya sp. 7M TaxID=2812896 RepID=UPI001B8CBB54|nr:fasciclin domain-containing protein [Leptolyngbya sp. 7M]QYO65471.1 fasciclin domain-containing protein [Leptolyngbya sp. 7M]